MPLRPLAEDERRYRKRLHNYGLLEVFVKDLFTRGTIAAQPIGTHLAVGEAKGRSFSLNAHEDIALLTMGRGDRIVATRGNEGMAGARYGRPGVPTSRVAERGILHGSATGAMAGEAPG